MATVYLWKHTNLSTGHVSLGTNNAYLSFHPESTNPMNILYSKGHNTNGERSDDKYQEDCKKYGSFYCTNLQLSGMDHHIEEYVNNFLKSRKMGSGLSISH